MIVKARWRRSFAGAWNYYVGEFWLMKIYKTKKGVSSESVLGLRDSKQHKTLDQAIVRVQEATNEFVASISPDLVVEHDPEEPDFSEVDQ
ncbi:hypothetical protein EON81_14980 [bacterium]|nr:MAG: hypothetical protein EON81_14980 [bacterium]